MDEFHLKRMYPSPNGTLRNRIGRHGFADRYAATDFDENGFGLAESGARSQNCHPGEGRDPLIRRSNG